LAIKGRREKSILAGFGKGFLGISALLSPDSSILRHAQIFSLALTNTGLAFLTVYQQIFASSDWERSKHHLW